MKRFTPVLLALVSSMAVVLSPALGARPRYGGVLRLETGGAFLPVDPLAPVADAHSEAVRGAVLPLVFETLCGVDAAGSVRPALAVSWQSDTQEKRWQFRIRAGVKLHDGSLLTPAHVAAALRRSDSTWKVTEGPDNVTIESDRPMPLLAWQLAARRYSVSAPGGAGIMLGTGPFKIERIEPARLTLAAYADYWGGRPFLDGVAVSTGRPSREEATDLELGRADVVSLLPQDARRLSQRGFRVLSSRRGELVALVFDRNARVASNDPARLAVALAVDRASIANVLLQHQAEPAASVLPDWLSGYESLFPQRYDRGSAKNLVAALPPQLRSLTLTYPAQDPLAQGIADRVAVDLRDTGLLVRVEPLRAAPPLQRSDIRLIHAVFDVEPPGRLLARLVSALDLERAAATETQNVSSIEDAFRLEAALLDRNIVVPLVHVSSLYGVAAHVQVPAGLLVMPSGALNLADAWLQQETK